MPAGHGGESRRRDLRPLSAGLRAILRRLEVPEHSAAQALELIGSNDPGTDERISISTTPLENITPQGRTARQRLISSDSEQLLECEKVSHQNLLSTGTDNSIC